MVAQRQQLVTTLKKTSGTGSPGSSITIHETANTSVGANAAAHANLQSKGNVRDASWHWTVDDHEAVQSFLHNVKCWHAGTSAGNNTSIGIELAVNSDGDFTQTVENAAQLVAQIINERGLSVTDVVQHNRWSGKNCPTNLRNGSKGPTWASFLARVREILAGDIVPVPNPIPVPVPPKPAGWIDEDGLWGGDTNGLIQVRAGTVVDRELWGQYRPNAQPAFVEGWVYNYPTVKGSPAWAWAQGRLGTPQDGVFGQTDLAALEARAGFPYDGRLDKPSNTVKWLQHALNTNTF